MRLDFRVDTLIGAADQGIAFLDICVDPPVAASPIRMLAKQADTLMTFYNLEKEEVDGILQRLDYRLPDDYIRKNLEYYLARTSHGSTLSRVVHAHLANMIWDVKLSWELYQGALTSDYQDIQGGTTGEGIHAGVMAGTVWIAVSSYGGLDLKAEMATFTPKLPEHWRKISFGFTFRGNEYECEIRTETQMPFEAEHTMFFEISDYSIRVVGRVIGSRTVEHEKVYYVTMKFRDMSKPAAAVLSNFIMEHL